MDTILEPQSRVANFNSLDRRDLPRQAVAATIYAPWKDNLLKVCPVIECTNRGARVVLSGPVERNEQLSLIVTTEGKRLRTCARVAWTSNLSNGTSIVGLDFQREDLSLAV